MNEELHDWAIANEPDDKMYWKEGYWDQIRFSRDIAPSLLFSSREGVKLGSRVVSTHRSKSITLPVVCYSTMRGKIYTRYNFFNWKVSFDLEFATKMQIPACIAVTNEQINSIYCEGFQKEWCFEPFSENKKQFTVELRSKYDVYTLFALFQEAEKIFL